MKNLFLPLAFLLAFAGSSIMSFGQNNKEGIKAINLAYQTHTQLTMDITYKVFESWDASKPLQVEIGALKRSGKMICQKIGQMEFVQNPSYTLVLDHDDKTIAIMGIYGDMPDLDFNSLLPNMEKALQHCQEIKHKDLNNDRGQYDLVLPDEMSIYKKIGLVYNKSTHLLQGITLYYAKSQDIMDDKEEEAAPRLEITYSNIDTNPKFAADTFTYEAFLKKVGKTLQCKEKYARYELIDKYSRT